MTLLRKTSAKNILGMRAHSLLWTLSLLVLLFLTSCSRPYEETGRLEQFYQVLDSPTQQQFQAGELESVVAYLNTLEEANKDQFEHLEQIKAQEAIRFFTMEQTVEYFYKHFYQASSQ